MEEHKDFPNFYAALLILALLFGLQIIISIIAYDLGFVFEAGDPIAVGLITIISCGFIFSLLLKYKKIAYAEIFNTSSNSIKSMLALLTAPLLLTAGGAVFWISDITNLIILHYPIGQNEYMMFVRLFGGGLVTIITVCVIAPFAEEILFRGIFLRSFLVNYSTVNAIILSALLFALSHLNIYQIPVALIIGCFLGWLYVRTRSLWPCIVGHSLYNACALIFWTNSAGWSKTDPLPVVEFNSIAVNAAAVFASISGVLILRYILRPKV